MRFLPQTLVGRSILVLLIGLIASHLIGIAIYFGDRHTALTSAGGRQVADRIAAATRFIEALPPAGRPRALRSLWGPVFSATWTPNSVLDASARDWRARLVRSALVRYLDDVPPERIRVAYGKPTAWTAEPRQPKNASDPRIAMERHMRRMMVDPSARRPARHMSRMMQVWYSGEILTVSVQLADRSWLNFATPARHLKSFWWSRVFFSIVLMAITAIVLSAWAIRSATRPLGAFARAAEQLGMDMDTPALDEKGPLEVRRAARAFNEMQRRLRTFVRDRTLMLAAISHDLRTPITRLRLRAEFVEDTEQRDKMLSDLEQMEAMISATLSFAHDDAGEEPRKPFDLAVLLQGLCDDAVDAGHRVTYDGEPRKTFSGRVVALKRAFGNLIDNATSYGVTTQVAMRTTPERVTVTIADDGPGIPEDQFERVFTPFYRVENSRSRETGGVGLGLVVVRSVIRGHGGDVTLANRDGGGLLVTVNLPLG